MRWDFSSVPTRQLALDTRQRAGELMSYVAPVWFGALAVYVCFVAPLFIWSGHNRPPDLKWGFIAASPAAVVWLGTLIRCACYTLELRRRTREMNKRNGDYRPPFWKRFLRPASVPAAAREVRDE